MMQGGSEFPGTTCSNNSCAGGGLPLSVFGFGISPTSQTATYRNQHSASKRSKDRMVISSNPSTSFVVNPQQNPVPRAVVVVSHERGARHNCQEQPRQMLALQMAEVDQRRREMIRNRRVRSISGVSDESLIRALLLEDACFNVESDKTLLQRICAKAA